MIGFYILVSILSVFILFFAPYIAASKYVQYKSGDDRFITVRALDLSSAIRWFVATVIFTVTLLYSLWGLKDAIFSNFGYLC